ncbi:MAG: M15 family metallopeptidase [Kineosporiaceae bacterium]|nr:M15 family metallopeptidase [Kineosporiaceae bacterium]
MPSPRATPVRTLVAAIALLPATAWPAPAATTPATLPPFTYNVHRVSAAELGASWRSGCPVAPSSLRRIRMTHLGWDGRARTGDLVVHNDIAGPTVVAFRRLYTQRFPIRSMRPISVFGGSDDRSMAADNTSGFNCRKVTGGTGWSRHAFGRAIDLNPVENPYVKGATVLPPAGAAYVRRTPARKGMLVAGTLPVTTFTGYGWSWGGNYRSLKDFQHLER